MNKNFKIGAILAIVSGALGILWGILIFANLHFAYWWQIMLVGGILQLICGLFTVLMGLFGWRQKSYSLALAGSIAGVFSFFPTAVAAIVLVSLGRKGLHQQTAVA